MHPQTVASTALKLIASMKRDWIHTGRRPSGVCAGALFIACHAHGHERSMEQVLAFTICKHLVHFVGCDCLHIYVHLLTPSSSHATRTATSGPWSRYWPLYAQGL